MFVIKNFVKHIVIPLYILYSFKLLLLLELCRIVLLIAQRNVVDFIKFNTFFFEIFLLTYYIKTFKGLHKNINYCYLIVKMRFN